MPRIPGVPTLDPVNKPQMSPGEAGRVGGAVSDMGEVGQADSQMEWHIRAAQEHVDGLAARNELDAAYANVQNQLAHTANSRDVAGVIEQGNKTLNDISSQWSKSPASVAIQQDADSLRPSLSHVGTVKTVDLMGKENKINLNHQGELLAATYAQDRTMGGSGDAALTAFTTAVSGGVKTGLMGDVEAGEYVREFRQKGQLLQIKGLITNANPDVNRKVQSDMEQHPEMFPDVTKEQLDVLQGQAMSAIQKHIELQKYEKDQDALNHQLPAILNQYKDLVTGRIDEGKALANNVDRFTKGEITSSQMNVLAQGIESATAQQNVAYKEAATKTKNNAVDLFNKRHYSEANQFLQQHRDDPEFAQDYESLVKYGDSMKREDRAEYREGVSFQHQNDAYVSNNTLNGVLAGIQSGHQYTDAELYGTASGKMGVGKGQMNITDIRTALSVMHGYENDMGNQVAINMLKTSYPDQKFPKDATPEQIAKITDQNNRNTQRTSLTLRAYQQYINEHPDVDKPTAMKAVQEPIAQKAIMDSVNALFASQNPSFANNVSGGFTRAGVASFFGFGPKETPAKVAEPPAKSATPPPIIQHSASTGKDRYSTDGGKTWQAGKPK